MDAHVTRAVAIIFVLIALVTEIRQEEEEEEEAVVIAMPEMPEMVEMVEEEDAVPRQLVINPEPLWPPGNISTQWIPIPLLKSMESIGNSAIVVCVQ